MSLEWGNAVVTAGPQAQEQSLPYVHAAEVPAFHSQGVGEDRNLDSEGKVHSSQLLDAYSSLQKISSPNKYTILSQMDNNYIIL